MRAVLLVTLPVFIVACSNEVPNRVVGELASDRIEISAEFAEPIVSVDVREGQILTAGQVILQQDDSRARARLAEFEALVQQYNARLDELKRGPRSEKIDQARANLNGASRELAFRTSDLKRVRDVEERGLASGDALDKATAAFDAAVANLALRRAQLEEQLTGTTVEELTQAEQALKQAEARRDVALIDLERHTVKAPSDGIADTRLFEPGERPVTGQPVFVMLGGEQAYARVFVPESMRASITTGTAATIAVDGLSEKLEGRVRWVSSDPAFTPYYALTERDRGRLSYMAKIDIVNQRERLPDGVPVDVSFDLQQ